MNASGRCVCLGLAVQRPIVTQSVEVHELLDQRTDHENPHADGDGDPADRRVNVEHDLLADQHLLGLGQPFCQHRPVGSVALLGKQGLGFELIAAKDHAESALLVQQGRAEAFGMDDILLYGVRASALNPSALVVVGEPIQVEPYAIMLRRDDPAFKKLVDDTLKELIRNGEFVALYKKWFESPIPPRGINLNAPMSEELRNNMKNLSDQPAL